MILPVLSRYSPSLPNLMTQKMNPMNAPMLFDSEYRTRKLLHLKCTLVTSFVTFCNGITPKNWAVMRRNFILSCKLTWEKATSSSGSMLTEISERNFQNALMVFSMRWLRKQNLIYVSFPYRRYYFLNLIPIIHTDRDLFTSVILIFEYTTRYKFDCSYPGSFCLFYPSRIWEINIMLLLLLW